MRAIHKMLKTSKGGVELVGYTSVPPDDAIREHVEGTGGPRYGCPACNNDFLSSRKYNVKRHMYNVKNGVSQCPVILAHCEPRVVEDVGYRRAKDQVVHEAPQNASIIYVHCVDHAGMEYMPRNLFCMRSNVHSSKPCKLTKGKWLKKVAWTMQGPRRVWLRRYKCKTHQLQSAFGVHDPVVLAELATVQGSLTNIVFEQGSSTYDEDLINHIWTTYIDNGFNVQAVQRSIHRRWHAAVLRQQRSLPRRPNSKMGALDGENGDTPHEVLQLKRAVPPLPNLRRILIALSNLLAPAMDTIDWAFEGVVIRFDATYKVARTIMVWHRGRFVKVNYCVGTSIGRSGKVLQWDGMPSESEDAIRPHFTKLFAQMDKPPFALFLDDVQKWKRIVHDCAVVRWDADAADGVLFGLDVMHWRTLLLRCVDRCHADFRILENGVLFIVGRILGYHLKETKHQSPGFFEDVSELKSAVQRLYDRHSGQRPNRGIVPKGGKFVKAAEFNLCAALGQCIVDESESKPQRLNFNAKEALHLGERGILSGGIAKDVWGMVLEKDDEYWESLLVSTKVVRKGITPGTWEGWHNAVQRYRPKQGLVSIHHAQTQLNIVAGFHNYGVSHAFYEGTWKAGTPLPNPVPDRAGNEQATRLRKKRVLREDHRSGACTAAIAKVLGTTSAVFTAMQAVRNFAPPPNTFEYLTEMGFKCRISNRTPLSKEEKEKVKNFLVQLNTDGPKLIFPYTTPIRYCARVVLHGERSEIKVGTLVRGLFNKYSVMVRQRAAIRSEVATTKHTGRVPGLAEMAEVVTNVFRRKSLRKGLPPSRKRKVHDAFVESDEFDESVVEESDDGTDVTSCASAEELHEHLSVDEVPSSDGDTGSEEGEDSDGGLASGSNGDGALGSDGDSSSEEEQDSDGGSASGSNGFTCCHAVRSVIHGTSDDNNWLCTDMFTLLGSDTPISRHLWAEFHEVNLDISKDGKLTGTWHAMRDTLFAKRNTHAVMEQVSAPQHHDERLISELVFWVLCHVVRRPIIVASEGNDGGQNLNGIYLPTERHIMMRSVELWEHLTRRWGPGSKEPIGLLYGENGCATLRREACSAWLARLPIKFPVGASGGKLLNKEVECDGGRTERRSRRLMRTKEQKDAQSSNKVAVNPCIHSDSLVLPLGECMSQVSV